MGRFAALKLGRWDRVAIATLGLLALAFLLGGASRENALSLAVVELTALPLLVLLAFDRLSSLDWREHRFALLILGGTMALPLLQLIPLPSSFVLGLPGRGDLRTALDLAGLSPAWLPISLTPDETWRAFLFLLPPAAMFLAILTSGVELGRKLMFAIAAACLFSMLLGAAQLASGGDRLYPWTTTDAGQVVGLFANRNHLATLCLITLPFAAIWIGRLERIGERRNIRWIGIVYIIMVLVTLAAIRSRAGVVLLGPALTIGLVAAWSATGRGVPRRSLVIQAVAFCGILVAISVFAAGPILQRFESHATQEGRFENWPYVVEAADAYLPLGGGLGSFDPIYRSVEPLAQVDPTYFNHAHNEYLELWLETGWLGPALLIAFLVWWGRRSLTAWRGGASTARDLQRAASGAIALMLLHSVGDYPLRTETLAVILALCCGLLESAARAEHRRETSLPTDAGAHRQRRRRT